MKKTVSLFLVILTVLSACLLASCGGTPTTPTTEAPKTESSPAAQTTAETSAPTTAEPVDPLAGLDAAIEKTAALTAYKADMVVTNKVTTGETVKNVNANYTIAVNGKTAIGSRVVKVDEAQAQVDVYMENNTVYVNKGGDKTKGVANNVNFKEYDLTALVTPLIVKIQGVTPKASEKDGATVATYELTEDQLKSAFASFTEELAAGVAAAEGTGLSYSDGKVVITFKGEYVTEYALSFKVSAKVGEKTVAGEASVTVSYKDPGASVEVTAPADLADYKA